MGNIFGCIEETVDIERLDYDMTPVKSKKIPIVWIIGPPGTGKNSYVNNLCDNFQYEQIKTSDLIKNETLNDTERGRIVKDALNQNKRIPDAIVVDLLKESMLLRAKQAKGFVINGFPRTSKQAFLFVNEIDNVDCIIYLHGKIDEMVQRVQEEMTSSDITINAVKKDILSYMKEIKDATQRFGPKIEKIYVEKSERECYSEIEAAISSRISDVKLTIKKQINLLHDSVN